MARARNIKPSIMDNDELAKLPPLARLLFIYLWMLADREGRLHDRPNRIAAQALPFDRDADCDELLQALNNAGFIRRYECDGLRCIQIVAFTRHQNPHHRENPSEIPPELTNDNDKPGKGTARDAPCPSQAVLIPDSGFSDSIEEANASGAPPAPKPALPVQPCPHNAILDLWAELMPDKTQHDPDFWAGSARESHLRARWRDAWVRGNWQSVAEGIDYFRRLFTFVRRSPFLMGSVSTRGDPFRLTLAWLIAKENWIKVHERHYHRHEESATA